MTLAAAGTWMDGTICLNIDATWEQGTICASNDGRLRLPHTFTVGTDAGNIQDCSGVTGQVIVLAGGKIDKADGSANSFSVPVHNQGTITIGDSRTISFGNLQNETGGLLTGLGSAAGSVTNAGGDVNPAGGTFVVGSLDQSSGTTTVDGGDTLAVTNAHTQSGGLTTIAPTGELSAASHALSGGNTRVGGILTGPTTLTGGAVLDGIGQVSGNLTNTSGEVRPGRRPARSPSRAPTRRAPPAR